jgi:hypothetical protein
MPRRAHLPLLALLLAARAAAAQFDVRFADLPTSDGVSAAMMLQPLCLSVSVFAAAVERVAAAGLLPGGPLAGRTIFAPSDAAFDAALEPVSMTRAQFLASPPARLAETLALHMAAPGQLPLATRDVGGGAPTRRASAAAGAPPLLVERRMVTRTDTVLVPGRAGEPPQAQEVEVQARARAPPRAAGGPPGPGPAQGGVAARPAAARLARCR